MSALKQGNIIILTLGTGALRRHPERSPISWTSTPSSNYETNTSLRVSLLISQSSSSSDCVTLPIPTRSMVSGEELVFSCPDLQTARFKFEILLSNSKSLAFGITPNLSACNPVSLWKERDPLGGRLVVPLLGNGELVAELELEFVVVKGFSHKSIKETPFDKYTIDAVPQLVGHRGSGMNLPITDGRANLQMGENTIASFKMAEFLGASFVEFDAQLSRDCKVVIYHDFHLDDSGLPIAVSDLTSEQFLSMKPREGVSARSTREDRAAHQKSIRRRSQGDQPMLGLAPDQTSSVGKKKFPWKGNGDGTVQEPFTTLREALTTLPISIGFNIEIKYPLLQECEMDRLDPPECNKFVDAILQDVFDYAGDRKIIFSSFHPESARMARLKQNQYPVLFLTMGGVYSICDARCNSLSAASAFVQSAGLQGIVTDATPLVKYPSLAQSIVSIKTPNAPHGLWLLTYGGLNNVKGNAAILRKAGVHGVIVDRVRQVALELAVAKC
ncbi:Glycerophosphocholine phosphodiesterase [Blyttiomyces sp. JEL0837]|nr:Glycerophosphocholine phosphodiesterase [Blyttiomyces sp. JEL0837]